MKTADQLLSIVCREVDDSLFSAGLADVTRKTVDDQLYELQKLSLELQKFVLDVRSRARSGRAEDLLAQLREH